MDYIEKNPRTSQILQDLRNKNEVDEPMSMGELARSSLTPIEDLIADISSCFATYLQYVSDSGWDNTRFKRMTEGYVDPLITYICDTLEADEQEEPEQEAAPINNFKLMVRKNMEDNAEVSKENRDRNRNFTVSQKNAMIALQDNKCAGCGKRITSIISEADHKIPWESGGRTEIDNAWALCLNCHRIKTTLETVFRMEKGRRCREELSSKPKKDTVKTFEYLKESNPTTFEYLGESNPTGISYEFISNTIPDEVDTSATGEFSITLKNTGSMTWDNNYYLLGIGDTEKFCHTKWFFPNKVAPGEQGTIQIKYKAPFIPGAYTMEFALRLKHYLTLEPTLIHKVIVKKVNCYGSSPFFG